MDERFSASSCNTIDKKRMKVKFRGKTYTGDFINRIGHFYLDLIGKISAPFAKLFKAIINDDLPLSS